MAPGGSKQPYSDRVRLVSGTDEEWRGTDAAPLIERYNSASFLTHNLLIGTALTTIGAVVGLALQGRAFSANCIDNQCAAAQGYQGCMDWSPWVGTLLMLATIPPGLWALGAAIVEVGHNKHRWLTEQYFGALSVLSVVFVVLNVLTWAYLLKPATLYDYETNKNETLVNDALLVLEGGFFLFPLTSMGIVLLMMLGRFIRSRSRPNRILLAVPPSFTAPLNAPAFSSRAALALIALCTVLTFCCATFSSVWNYSAHSYFMATSEFSMIDGHINKWFTFKLYLDTVVFYGFLAALVLVAGAAHALPTLRSVLHHRVRLPALSPRSAWNPFPVGATVGELLLLAGVGGLYAFWIWHWRVYHTRITTETQAKVFDLIQNPKEIVCCLNATGAQIDGRDAATAAKLLFPFDATTTTTTTSTTVFGSSAAAAAAAAPPTNCTLPADENADLQIWARVVGHLATLSMSLLLFPVHRNSLWTAVFGVSFDRAVKYHRAMGVMVWLMTTLHMMLWMGKWLLDGTLSNNIVQIKYLQITPTLVHYDNFTILLAETAWLLMTVAVVLAIWWRRSNYELFYWAHHFSIVFFVVAIMHAWSFWYYAIGGLVLWLVDRSMRMLRRSQPVKVVSVFHHTAAGVTQVTLDEDAFVHHAGAFAYLCFPQISHAEWHPFTIASAPSSGFRSFFIKDMGPGTFTANLARLAKMSTGESDLVVRVDAPYGRGPSYETAEQLLLVAGGIGITPLHSILSELEQRTARGLRVGKLQKVTLVWAVRSRALVALMAPTLAAALKNTSFFDINVYCTTGESAPLPDVGGARDEGTSEVLSIVKPGRPPLGDIFRRQGPGSDTLVMVCGPEGMVADASEHAFANLYKFHSENFYF
eukprot:UC1_evm2s1448